METFHRDSTYCQVNRIEKIVLAYQENVLVMSQLVLFTLLYVLVIN